MLETVARGLRSPSFDTATFCVGVLELARRHWWHCWFHWKSPKILGVLKYGLKLFNVVGKNIVKFHLLTCSSIFGFQYPSAALLSFEHISTQTITHLAKRFWSRCDLRFSGICHPPMNNLGVTLDLRFSTFHQCSGKESMLFSSNVSKLVLFISPHLCILTLLGMMPLAVQWFSGHDMVAMNKFHPEILQKSSLASTASRSAPDNSACFCQESRLAKCKGSFLASPKVECNSSASLSLDSLVA